MDNSKKKNTVKEKESKLTLSETSPENDHTAEQIKKSEKYRKKSISNRRRKRR